MDDLQDLTFSHPTATPLRPLLGMTVLLVEDSRFASEAVRLLCLRSGARIRRADCLRSAERHLLTYRPTVAIVDLGLPDGSGLDLILRLATATQRPTVLLATSGNLRAEAEAEALHAGADGFLPKPIESLAAFQQQILSHLPIEQRPRGVRVVSSETVTPDPIAMCEDLEIVERMLGEPELNTRYISTFLKGIARTGHDDALLEGARAIQENGDDAQTRARVRALIASRLGTKRQVV